MALLATDAVDWALDSDGDLVMPLRFTRGLEAVAQGIRIRLQLIRGELFLDRDLGVPYLDGNGVDPALVILGNRFDRVRADAAFRSAVLRTPGVRRIRSMSLEFESRTRVLSASIVVETEFGDTSLNFATEPVS